MASITATVSVLLSLLAGCLAHPASATPTDGGTRQPPRVELRKQLQTDAEGHRFYRVLPVVTIEGDSNTARFVNSDLESTLGGAGFVDVATIPSGDEWMQIGDSRVECSTALAGLDVASFVCSGTSMGAHPYDVHHSLAYDLRPGHLKRLAPRDVFTDAGVTTLAKLVADRVRAQVAASELTPTLDPFELHADHVQITFGRCDLGNCMLSGASIRLTCAEVTPHLRSDSPWRCQ